MADEVWDVTIRYDEPLHPREKLNVLMGFSMGAVVASN